MKSSTALPALTIIMSLRGRFSTETSSATERVPVIRLPFARPFTKSSTFESVRLKQATLKPLLSMLRIRFSPITARPTRPMSAWLIEVRLLALDAGGAALGEGPHLLQARHGGVAREGGEQGAVRPPELERLLGLGSGQQAVEEA